MLNFISNALKFSSKDSEVIVEVECQNLFSSVNRDGKINDKSIDSKRLGKLQNEINRFEMQKVHSRSESSRYIFEGDTKIMPSPSMIDLLETNNQNLNLLYNQFTIKIIDHGPGISQQGIKNLFLDFSKLKEHGSQNQTGTGLGLSICKKIIQKMGGNVSVKSKPGQGSKFKVELTTLCQLSNEEIASDNYTYDNNEPSFQIVLSAPSIPIFSDQQQNNNNKPNK